MLPPSDRIGNSWRTARSTSTPAELAQGNPLRVPEDIEARERARQYLRQLKGIDRLYAGILANAEKSVAKSSRLQRLSL